MRESGTRDERFRAFLRMTVKPETALKKSVAPITSDFADKPDATP
jgi:hypothetical protein